MDTRAYKDVKFSLVVRTNYILIVLVGQRIGYDATRLDRSLLAIYTFQFGLKFREICPA